MKNLLIFFISISFVFNAFSQDNIILKDGTEISAKVSKIDQNNIEYKKFTNLDGPTYSIPIQNVFMIQYKNGTRDIFNTQSTNTQQQPTNSTNQNIPNLKIETVNIPAGTFLMGSTEEEKKNEKIIKSPQNQCKVTLSAFTMSKYEITNAQFAAFLNERKIGINGIDSLGTYPKNILIKTETNRVLDCGIYFRNGKWIPVKGFDNNPIVYVTWYGASEYAKYVGGRLPTEAEWEYACRANTTTPFNTGECLNKTDANYKWSEPYVNCSAGKSENKTTKKVGSYPPNAWGLYDMHGNVSEWCSDLYNDNYPTTEQINPQGPNSSIIPARVIRGGNWANGAIYCRSSSRMAANPDEAYIPTTGFRVVNPK